MRDGKAENVSKRMLP